MALNDGQPLSGLTDEQLIECYRSGQRQAYVIIVERYRRELFHFLLRYTNNEATADDVFQDTFLQIHLSVDSFQTHRKFRPWLFTIAANKARDQLRKDKRRQTVALSAPILNHGDGEQSHIDLLEARLPLPLEDAQRRETNELVQEVIASLPDHLREILLLAYFHRFAYKQIAQMLNIPLGTVKSRLHASVGTFAQLWKTRFQEHESQ